MRKIKTFSMQGEKFKPFEILDSDLSQDAKLVFLTLYLTPSQLVPIGEELKKYCSIKNSSRVKRACKELEIRGCLDMSNGQFVLIDKLLPAPVEQILPSRGEDKKPVDTADFHEFKKFFILGFQNVHGEPYNFQGGKDGQAIKQLLATYGLEGAKKKAETAWSYKSSNTRDEKFFQSCGRSIALLASQASKLIQTQITNQLISQEGKWGGHKSVSLGDQS